MHSLVLQRALSVSLDFSRCLMFTVFGNIMQDHPGISGYRNIFWICIGLAILGAVFVLILQKMINKMKNTVEA